MPLAEGETLPASGRVSHSYFEFYHHATEVSIEQSAWQAVALIPAITLVGRAPIA